jgi:dTDP-glucose 4,6-dehydratase
MDTTRIATELGWQPTETLVTGLEKTVDWYLANLEWVEVIRGQSDYVEWVKKNYGKQ